MPLALSAIWCTIFCMLNGMLAFRSSYTSFFIQFLVRIQMYSCHLPWLQRSLNVISCRDHHAIARKIICSILNCLCMHICLLETLNVSLHSFVSVTIGLITEYHSIHLCLLMKTSASILALYYRSISTYEQCSSIGLLLFHVSISIFQFLCHTYSVHIDSETQPNLRERSKFIRIRCNACFSRYSITVHAG
jgi:hypothetical protein